jgi:hypothetical protein
MLAMRSHQSLVGKDEYILNYTYSKNKSLIACKIGE